MNVHGLFGWGMWMCLKREFSPFLNLWPLPRSIVIMEVEGQVDLNHNWCGCSGGFAFRVCIHILYAIKSCDHLNSHGCEVLVEAQKRERSRRQLAEQHWRESF
ncbi:hypothetical protein PHMEG_00018861 [Phytophthora megakarya]|uniref:SWIM-type domain-containing protein n=1 Tax=Phytophthora megakarya TaxID=4795 RepID=A0A225VUA2_9STRA|nr:hypothetical protein PHMEG_00018861 [Phytophthora megakarya]